ncbi:S-layer homology domain-containing protein, partial [Bacillus sp. JJ722]|uniref:S-layer homology domain-containing protein n=1 Tax=Bacillus sp. JJ722 TaxID=3122973 RepID=UPI002FFE9E34
GGSNTNDGNSTNGGSNTNGGSGTNGGNGSSDGHIGDECATTFKDIENHWAKKEIESVVEKCLFLGTKDNMFNPEGTMSRAMFVTVLHRLEDDKNEYVSKTFKDVNYNDYYAKPVEWAYKNKLIKGVTSDTFNPHQAITRQEMAVIMDNYINYKNIKLPTVEREPFSDSKQISKWAEDSVEAIYEASIMNGRKGNKFDPLAKSTRAEVAVILDRFLEKTDK